MLRTITREEFSQAQAVSFSRLAALANSPQAYRSGLEEEKSSSGLTFGSLVDSLLTQPEKLNNDFYVMTAKKPESEMMLRFAEKFAESGDIVLAYNLSGYKISIDALKTKFDKEGKAYYDALKASKGKEVISFDMMTNANKVVSMLKNNPFTKKYFEPSEDVEILYQVPILWEFEGRFLPDENISAKIPSKILLDIIRIDHKARTIEPIDIKTGAEGFMKAYWKYRLYLQGSLYYYGVNNAVIQSENKSQYYRVLNTKFIYSDSDGVFPPVIYRMTDNDLTIGREGYYPMQILSTCVSTVCDGPLVAFPSTKPKYKGFVRLAEELLWHKNNDLWDYPYDVYQSQGEIEIDSFIPKF